MAGQARYWILTIPYDKFIPPTDPKELHRSIAFITGQQEIGAQRSPSTNSGGDELRGSTSGTPLLEPVTEPRSRCVSPVEGTNSTETSCVDERQPIDECFARSVDAGYHHWQLIVIFDRKVRRKWVRDIFGPFWCEPTRSNRAESYCHKERTGIPGTGFECGKRPINRGKDRDWEAIRNSAKLGLLDDIPADVYVRNYNALKRIAVDHMRPTAQERQVDVYWGLTNVGKSFRAWREAGMDAYPKDPNSKFWDGYRGQEHVVIDEFRGKIDISHILRWFDHYPCIVDVKGSSHVFGAKRIWVTSNLHPRSWYPTLDTVSVDALVRRLNIFEVTREGNEEPLLIAEE